MLSFHCYCSKRIQFALTILLLGVGIATVTDLQLNALGSFLSFLAVITTCVAQIVSLSNFICINANYFCNIFWSIVIYWIEEYTLGTYFWIFSTLAYIFIYSICLTYSVFSFVTYSDYLLPRGTWGGWRTNHHTPNLIFFWVFLFKLCKASHAEPHFWPGSSFFPWLWTSSFSLSRGCHLCYSKIVRSKIVRSKI